MSQVRDLSLWDKGFKSVNNPNSTQYIYDANGNLKSDLNKGIPNIEYNYLNLPMKITIQHPNNSEKSGSIELVYDATGAKLRKMIKNNSGTVMNTYDYVNGVEYKNQILQRVAHSEGAVVRNDFGQYQHEYVLRDHLGNTRVTFRDGANQGEPYWDWSNYTYHAPDNTGYDDGVVTKDDIVQINHYYPFGLNMEGDWNGAQGKNKYQYNGKEWNDDFGLGWNHHDWRFYDVALNRFVTIDPESEQDEQEQLNPYHFCLDNPILYNDPDGRNPIGALIGAAVEYGTQVATNYYQGNESPFTSNINISAIGVAAVEGALTSGASAGKKIAIKVGAALVNNIVEVKTGDQNNNGELTVKVETNPSNVVKNATVDLAVNAVAGKAGSKTNTTVKKAATAVGIKNHSTGKLVKQTITNSGGIVNKATNAAVKSGVKKAGNQIRKTVGKSSETVVKAGTDKSKSEAKAKTDF